MPTLVLGVEWPRKSKTEQGSCPSGSTRTSGSSLFTTLLIHSSPPLLWSETGAPRLKLRLPARSGPVTGEEGLRAAGLHAEVDVWAVGAPEKVRGHGGTRRVRRQRWGRRVQRDRLPRTVPRQQPASRQGQGQRQDHDGQNGSPDRAVGHAGPLFPSRRAAPSRPFSRPTSICRRSAAPPLAPSHPGTEVGVAGAPRGGKGGWILPWLPSSERSVPGASDLSVAQARRRLLLRFRISPEVPPRHVC